MKYALAFLLFISNAYADGVFTRSITKTSSSSGLTGSGVAGQNAYWNNTNTLTYDPLISDSGAGLLSALSLSASTIIGTSISATNVSITNGLSINNNILASNTEILYASGSTVDGAHGIRYDRTTNSTLFGIAENSVATTPSATVHISGTLRVTGGVSMTGLAAGTAVNNVCLTSTGNVISSSTLSGCLGVSDPKVKGDIQPLAYGLKQIMALQPVSYIDQREGAYPGRQVGLLAYSVIRKGIMYDGVEQIMPELVDQHGGEWHGETIKGLAYDRLGVPLVAAVQEQQAEIAELQERVGTRPTSFRARLKWLLWGNNER